MFFQSLLLIVFVETFCFVSSICLISFTILILLLKLNLFVVLDILYKLLLLSTETLSKRLVWPAAPRDLCHIMLPLESNLTTSAWEAPLTPAVPTTQTLPSLSTATPKPIDEAACSSFLLLLSAVCLPEDKIFLSTPAFSYPQYRPACRNPASLTASRDCDI